KRACALRPILSPREFASRLRAWRKSHRFTQARAADVLQSLCVNVAAGSLTKWETCAQTPHRPMMRAILDAMAQPVDRDPLPRAARTIHPRTFGALLRRWRKSRGLSQGEAMAFVGVGDQGTLSHWERGSRAP